MESEARYYVRMFPTVFAKASGAQLWDEGGKPYIDFLSGAGALNYGHNNLLLRERLIAYLESDGVVHSLDMATSAKENFIKTFEKLILRPRDMNYRLQFTGPTGSNAVEAALKLARKVKRRTNIISFTNGYHGVSVGALAATADAHLRQAAGVALGNVSFMPYEGYFGAGVDTIAYLERMLDDRASGIDAPAAVIVETVQGEGGVRVASHAWLQALERCCRRHDMLLIVDDMQAGCGRTGRFFSFEEAGIKPDIVTMAHSLSGYGLPLSLVLIRPELDKWLPGEHNGTFRGNNLAFVCAMQALQSYWQNDDFSNAVKRKEIVIGAWFEDVARKYPQVGLAMRGKGLIHGLSVNSVHGKDAMELQKTRNIRLHRNISHRAFERGLIVATAETNDDVLKLLPPLVIDEQQLRKGLDVLGESIAEEADAAMSETTAHYKTKADPAFPELMHT